MVNWTDKIGNKKNHATLKRKIIYLDPLTEDNKLPRRKIKGKRACGRSRMSWIHNIKYWTGIAFNKTKN